MTAKEVAEKYAGQVVTGFDQSSQMKRTGRLVAYFDHIDAAAHANDRGKVVIEQPGSGTRRTLLDSRVWVVDDLDASGGFRASPDTVTLAAATAPAAASTKKADDRYPHRCPRCSGPAYIGLEVVDCCDGCKR